MKILLIVAAIIILAAMVMFAMLWHDLDDQDTEDENKYMDL